ncbi:multiple organellar RNA editing factor 1, mitochondrial-like [Populus nigra]|uniref:multiple organellar RNA editing factor 1, mitochondrial-like n=1 Tax=Populus nigra TaxID=3691 RepID=UPI002B26FCB6|nr:multiple organellar RNA editing factor 1, mitochondrial-like [Populus nigra]
MAQRLLRLRRALTPLSSTRQRSPSLPAPMAIAPPAAQTPPIISQWRGFSGTRVSMTSTAAIGEKQYWAYENLGEITENKTLFEGCAYNYWLVTVDFPKEEPKPSPREMIAAYERICAQGLNSSIEEAKKRIYACSTTTFQGFQVLMTEQESEKFRDVPRVVFVLPDSPGNKEYEGDEYEHRMITPGPTTVQFQRGGERCRHQGRIPPRFDQRDSPIPNNQRLQPQNSQQGRLPGGGGNYRSQQNGPPQQNHGPPGLGGRMPMNNRDYAPGGRNMYPGQQGNHDPPGQQGYNHGQQRNHYPPGGGGNHDPPGQQGYNHGQQRNHHPQGQGYNQGQQGNHYAPDQRSFPQGDWRDHGPHGQRDYKGDNWNYSPTHGGNYGQGGIPPRFDQRESPIPNYHGLQPQYSQQGCMQGGGSNYGYQQNGPPQQNHGPPGLGGRMLMNNRDYAPGGRNMYPGQQGNHDPPGQQGYNEGEQVGGSNYRSQQNGPPQQNHGPPGLGGRMLMNNRDYAPGGRNMYPGQQGNHDPPGQQGYNEGEQVGGSNYRSQQNGPPQQNHGPAGRGRMPMNNRDYAPGERNTYPGQHGNRVPPGQQGYNQGEQRSHYPPGQQGYNPEQQGNHFPPGQGYNQGRQGNHHPPGQQGYFQRQQGNQYDPDQRSFTQGDWRDHESPGQRDYRGENWNYSPTYGGNYGQGGNSSYGQRNPGEG